MITTVQNNKIAPVEASNKTQVYKSVKLNQIGFKGFDDSDNFSPKEINYRRVARLIVEEVPIEKINAICDDMLDSPDQSFLEKIISAKTKMSRKIQRKFSKEQVDENMVYALTQALGDMIPDALKVERDDEFFDLPHSTNSSIVNILNSVDNYSDFFESVDRYFEHMEKFGYDKNSVLPIVTDVKSSKNYTTLLYDRKLVKQKK